MSEIVGLNVSPIISANKADMVGMVNSYLKDVAINGGEPLKDLAICRKYMFMLEEIEKGLKDFAIKELSNFDRSETEVLDVLLKEVETGVKYDFSASTAWVVQKKKVEEETAKLKSIETFIKGCTEKTTTVNPDTGEVMEYFPPTKSSSTSIRATLK